MTERMAGGVPLGNVTLARKDGHRGKGGPYQSRVELAPVEIRAVKEALRESALNGITVGKMLELLGEEVEYRVTLSLFTKAKNKDEATAMAQRALGRFDRVKLHDVGPAI